MRRPLIAVTTYGRDAENRFPLPAEYVDAVRRAGATPILWPPGEPHLDDLLEVVSGLIIAGGGDVAPEVYGGQAHKTLYMLDHERDSFEIGLARRAVDSGLPTLGICRGMQIVNVALGGTLYPHLPEVFGEKILHRLPPRKPTPHEITLDSNSRLARMLGADRFSAASWHHQALRAVAPPLRVVGQSADGVIEAVELPDHPWLCAVQWHPELTAAEDARQQKLFAALVEACSGSSP